MECIFCKIIRGEIATDKLYEDEDFIIFKDIDPKARLHYLAVPKNHYATLEEMPDADKAKLGGIMAKVGKLSKELGFEDGYRLIINQDKDGGQTVFHLHMHLLGGQQLPFDDFTK